jgi:uncharacterized membrane protein YbaN (DUF454 family)
MKSGISGFAKIIYFICGVIFTILGIIGLLIPIIPGFILLIPAFFCFKRGFEKPGNRRNKENHQYLR